MVLLSGCSAQPPQSAEALRQAVLRADVASGSFEVKRRYRDVAGDLQRHVGKCLNVMEKGAAYKSTMIVSSRKAELHLLRHVGPDNGYYLLVVDVYPVGRSLTRMHWFGPARGYESLIQAVRGWASGASACPDMKKTG